MYVSRLDLEHQYSNINGFSIILSYPEDAVCVLIIRIFLKWYKYRKKNIAEQSFSNIHKTTEVTDMYIW